LIDYMKDKYPTKLYEYHCIKKKP